MEELEKIQTEIPEDICTIQIDYYGRKLAIGVITGKIYIFESNQDTMIKTSEIISHFGPIYELSWSHPSFGPLLASSGFDKKVILYKIDNDRIEEIYSHKNHDNIVKTLKFCPSSNKLLLISGCLNGYIVTCEYYNKDFILNKLFAHDFGVNAIDFLDDNNFITCGNDNSIKIWNYSQQDGKVEIQKILELKDEINNMSTYDLSCKDDKHFVCCGESNGEGVVNYWILKEGKWEVKEICRSKEKFEKIKAKYKNSSIISIKYIEGQNTSNFTIFKRLAIFKHSNIFLYHLFLKDKGIFVKEFFAMKSNETNKKYGAIVSENMPYMGTRSIVKVNPFDSEGILKALNQIYGWNFNKLRLESDLNSIKKNKFNYSDKN